MVFVAILVPFGTYLLFLGWLNRLRQPVLLTGVWDFIGVLGAASGLLFFGGPATISSTSERWRMAWVLGEFGSVVEGLRALRQIDYALLGLYLVLVVAVSGLVLFRRRCVTSIYNVQPGVVEDEITEVCRLLELEVRRSGHAFVFGLEGTAEKTVLEIETFPAMRHVTLYWDAVEAPVRRLVENELEQRLAEVVTPYHDTGTWLMLAGSAMMGASFLILLTLTLRALLLV